MTDSASASPTVPSATADPFPPQTIEAFLRCCAGEWMSLRSQFRLGINGDEDAEAWHNSERGELLVQYLDASATGQPEPGPAGPAGPTGPTGPARGPGGIQVIPKRDGALQAGRTLLFAADGQFSSKASGGTGDAGPQGRWTLWPDGSLELVMTTPTGELREKIWFTKPNLRLRSTVESRSDGTPGQASFSSEIRRVSRPAS